jgi:hypothetical protein
MYEIAHMKEG